MIEFVEKSPLRSNFDVNFVVRNLTIMNDFLAWSGWFFGFVSAIIAFLQFREKRELKKQVRILTAITGKVEMHAKDKGVAINSNNGDINFH